MLDQRVAFITGAAGGIGAGTARRFAQEGARVVLADVQEEAGIRVRDEITASSQQAIYVSCDVSDASSIEHAITAAVEQFGRLDGVACSEHATRLLPAETN